MKKSKLRALIVDDEVEARELLHFYLMKNPGISEIEEAVSAEDALFKYFDFMPDIIFLDIVMPERNGMKLVELFKKRELNSIIVIVSGLKEAAIKAIKNNVYDFILKPIKEEELNRIIDKYRLNKSTNLDKKLNKILNNVDEHKRIKISSTFNHTIVSPKEILYCEADGSYTNIYLDDGRMEVANNYLGQLEKMLSNQHFFRIRRSLLINLNKLKYINTSENSCTLTINRKDIKLYGSKKRVRELCEMDF